jgi:hypothetical protein
MKALLRQEYIASCEKRGREIDGVSNDPVSRFVVDYESIEDVKADLQKLGQMHHKGTSALLALTSYGSPVLGTICLRITNAIDAALPEPRRAEYS